MANSSTRLDYNNGVGIIPKGHIRVGASGIAKYVTSTRAFWGELMLGEDGFMGSTASVLGTCTHFYGEDFIQNGTVDEEEIEKYINKFPHLDQAYIREQHPIMGSALLDYIDTSPSGTLIPEKFVFEEILPGIGVGGSIDLIAGDTIVDWKTTSALSAPKTMSYQYKLQLLTYAWILRKQGHEINRIRIVYITTNITGRVSETTGKPMKDYPTDVSVLDEQITEEDMEMIEGIINVIAASVKRWQDVPTDRYLLAQDWRLRPNVARKRMLFK